MRKREKEGNEWNGRDEWKKVAGDEGVIVRDRGESNGRVQEVEEGGRDRRNGVEW